MLKNYYNNNNFSPPYFFLLLSFSVVFTLKLKKSLTANYTNPIRKIDNRSDSNESISPALYIYILKTTIMSYRQRQILSAWKHVEIDQCVLFSIYDLKATYRERVYLQLVQLKVKRYLLLILEEINNHRALSVYLHINVGRRRGIRYNSITLTIRSRKRKSKSGEKNLREREYFSETDATVSIANSKMYSLYNLTQPLCPKCTRSFDVAIFTIIQR